MRFFASGFFHQSVSPQPQSILLGPFQIFTKIRRDIRSSRLTTGVADTGGKWKKSSIRKILIIFVGTPLDSRVNIYIHFRLQVHFKVSAAWYKSHCLPLVSLTQVATLLLCRWYRWQFATGVVDTGGKFAAGIVDTGGKFATGLNNTSKIGGKICRRCHWYRWQICHRCRWYRWSTLSCEYLREFSKKFETAVDTYT